MWMDIAQEVDEELHSDEEDTVYDRRNSLSSKNPFEAETELRIILNDEDTRCGILNWRPNFLQKFANKTFFSIVFTIVGIFHGSFWSYYTANISTFEKRFNMNSTTSGILLFSHELAQILMAIVFTYFGFRRHRGKILTVGLALSSLSCFLMASPHYYVGSGDIALNLVRLKSSNADLTVLDLPSRDKRQVSLTGEDLSTSFASLTTIGVSVSSSESLVIIPNNASTTIGIVDMSLVTDTPLNGSINSTMSSIKNDTLVTQSSVSAASTVKLLPTIVSSFTTDKAKIESTEEPTITKATIYIDENDEVDQLTEIHPYLNDQLTKTSEWPICNPDVEDINKTSKSAERCVKQSFERNLAFTFMFCANFVGGLGSIMFLLSGGPFAEDTTILPNELPRIFGITLALRLVGPFFGYLFAWSCLSEFINLNNDVSQMDSRWLGAWWLGWTLLGVFMAFSGVIFLLFPRQSPKEYLKKRSLTHETGSSMLLIPNIASFFGGAEMKAANLLPSITHLANVLQGFLRNRVYFLMTFSIMLHVFVGVGYWTFFPKYLEFMFRVQSADAAMLTGISSVPFQVAGLMLGGAFISRFLPSTKEISAWSVIVTSLQIVALLVIAFLGCNTDKIDVSFKNSYKHEVPTGLANSGVTEHCSAKCDCTMGPILPICDMYSGTTFYSPCTAGCEHTENNTEFHDCSCSFSNATLIEGYCPGNECNNGLIVFIVLTCLSQFFLSSGVVGRMLICFKAIQPDQRSWIIGMTMVMLSVIAIIPSPIVYGSLIEFGCLVRQESCGDNDQIGNCWLYDDTFLRFAFNLGTTAFLVLALVFDVMLWKSEALHELRIYDGELSQQSSSINT